MTFVQTTATAPQYMTADGAIVGNAPATTAPPSATKKPTFNESRRAAAPLSDDERRAALAALFSALDSLVLDLSQSAGVRSLDHDALLWALVYAGAACPGGTARHGDGGSVGYAQALNAAEHYGEERPVLDRLVDRVVGMLAPIRVAHNRVINLYSAGLPSSAFKPLLPPLARYGLPSTPNGNSTLLVMLLVSALARALGCPMPACGVAWPYELYADAQAVGRTLPEAPTPAAAVPVSIFGGYEDEDDNAIDNGAGGF